MKGNFENLDKVNILREVQALRRLSNHPNIITLLEVIFDGDSGKLALVFELMAMNAYEMIRDRKTRLPERLSRSYFYQLLKSVHHIHRHGIFHRDLKPENILVTRDKLKLADLGSCRGVRSAKPYTEYISTRWYRAPECLLTSGQYDQRMDIWGVGCCAFEIISLAPLFPGDTEKDQLDRIHRVLGSPTADVVQRMCRRSIGSRISFPKQTGSGIASLIPFASAACVDIIEKLLAYNPDDRISAKAALSHPYFRDLCDEDRRKKLLKRAKDAAPGRRYEHRSVSQVSRRQATPLLPTIKVEVHKPADLSGKVLPPIESAAAAMPALVRPAALGDAKKRHSKRSLDAVLPIMAAIGRRQLPGKSPYLSIPKRLRQLKAAAAAAIATTPL